MLSIEDVKWLGSLLVPVIALNVALISVILNDKLKNPLRIAILFNLLYAAVVGIIVYFATHSFIASLSIIVDTGASFAVIFYVLKERDRKAITLAERFIEFLRIVDVQTSYILAAAAENKSHSNLNDNIDQALKYILDLLGDFLVRDDNKVRANNHDHYMSIFLAKNSGKFEVLASTGLTPLQIKMIQSQFSYKPQISSVAGYAAAKSEFVCITDLAAETTPEQPSHYWMLSEAHEKKEGFLICYPITRGVGQQTQRPMAVISLSSHVRNAYDCVSARQFIDRVAPKIENLIYLKELLATRFH